jgi:hypothetical protein
VIEFGRSSNAHQFDSQSHVNIICQHHFSIAVTRLDHSSSHCLWLFFDRLEVASKDHPWFRTVQDEFASIYPKKSHLIYLITLEKAEQFPEAVLQSLLQVSAQTPSEGIPVKQQQLSSIKVAIVRTKKLHCIGAWFLSVLQQYSIR